jgi:amino acid adenylation domain-containing protein
LELKTFLSLELPDYMVPSGYVQIEEIPLTPNGKINKRALPEPGKEETINTTYPSPEDKTGRLMTKIWSEVLAVDEESIGLDANFFEIGGHSLKATLMLSRIYKEFNVKMPLKELFRLPTVRNLSHYIRRASQEQFMSIQPVEEKEHYALSSSQKRIYVLQQFDAGTTAYNLYSVVELEGLPDREKLKHTFVQLIERHEALRTSFHLSEDIPVQKIHRRVDFEIECYALEKETQTADCCRDKIVQTFMRAFDLSRAPLFRVGLIQIGDRQDLHVLMLDMHHIISDGISNGILMQDFMMLYGGKELAALKTSYKDFSQWQNRLLISSEMKKQEAFWLKEFEGDIPVFNLPTDYPLPLVRSFAGDVVRIQSGAEDTRAINALASGEKTTMFILLLALFYVLLSRLSAQEEVVVGTPTAGRRHADLYSIIGMFVNTLALKGSPKGEHPFIEFLRELKERILEAFENQDYQFETLVEKVVKDRDSGLNPLFDVMFSLRNAAGGLKIEIPGLKLTEQQYDRGTAKFGLTLIAEEVEENLIFSFEYCTDLFRAETVETFASYFKMIISSVLSNPGAKISGISIISDEEKARMLYDFNDTETVYPADKTIHRLFEEQVMKTPGITALSHKDEMTYGELNKKANQLARVLRGKGVKAGSVVGIMAEPSPEMITGLLAVLKAGGAYSPVDPGYPAKRVEFMIKNGNTQLLLIQDRFSNRNGITAEMIVLEDKIHYNGDGTDLVNVNSPGDPVYIIYTSGSTGAAKGILLEHKGVVNYVKWAEKNYLKEEKIDFPLYSSLSFDLTVTSIYVPLVSGNKILVYDRDDREFVIEKIVNDGKAGIIKLTPTHLGILAQLPLNPEKKSIKKMIVGGEELTTEIAGRIYGLFGGDIEIFNEYGPTEATVACMIYEYNPARDSRISVPIGVPIDNAKIYILDERQKPVLPGVPGELCVSGDGLARGYLNRPRLTAEKFINNPFVPGGLIYRTGDTARWLPDGNVEFLGRMDDQVKIRGHRLEPGEIEYHLLTHEDIKEASVIAKEDTAGSGGTFLCAYLISRREPTVSELREYLSAKLPSYMVPSYFVFLEKMPLTASGKINRKALPEPEPRASEDYTTPENDIEKRLVEELQAVLGIDRVGIHDNFFQVGGDSVKAIQVSSRLIRSGLKLQIRDIFRTPTIRELSRCIKQSGPVIDQGPVEGEVKLSPIQQWFFQNNFSEMYHFNQSVMIYNQKGFLEKKIRDIFTEIVKHHDALRIVTGTVDSKTVLRNIV